MIAQTSSQSSIESVVLGGGCFWGVEELMRDQPGVVDTEVGYAGGCNDNPTFDHHPGHAEVVRISYDASVTNLDRLLDYFFTIHDPTTLNQQGNDIGQSYRSIIFYADDVEKAITEQMIERVNSSGRWISTVVTQLMPQQKFHPAEDEHQDYLRKHPGGYTCHYQRFASYG